MTLILAAIAALGLLQDDKIDALIKKLGEEKFSVREEATKELRKIGKPAEPALRKALDHQDPEVRQRAQRLLDDLKPEPKAEPRRPGQPQFGARGGSVSIQSVNGNSTYVITPGDGRPAITLHKSVDGRIKFNYTDDEGEKQTVQSASIEKFLEDHAGLAKIYGITKDGISYGGARATFNGGLFQGFRGRFRFNPDDFKPDPKKFKAPFQFRRLTPSTPRNSEVAGARLEPVSDALRAHFDIPRGDGLVVKSVQAGKPAHQAGLRKNDVLLAIDGKPVTSVQDARDRFKLEKTLLVLRKGERKTLEPKTDEK